MGQIAIDGAKLERLLAEKGLTKAGASRAVGFGDNYYCKACRSNELSQVAATALAQRFGIRLEDYIAAGARDPVQVTMALEETKGEDNMEADLKGINEAALMRANAKLREEINDLRGRLARYRAQCDHAISVANSHDRSKERMEKLRNGALTLAGLSFTVLVIIKCVMLITR